MSGYIVSALCAGKPAKLPGGQTSAIAKVPRHGSVNMTYLGLAGDTQVNTKYHGGPDMAVHLYPLAHREFWRQTIGDHPALEEPGAFGSNLAVDAIVESEVRLGQRFRLGSSVLEVSQPRMPCATIERRFGYSGMVKAILESGRCGWYFRVLEEGEAKAGDMLEPLEEAATDISIAAIFTALADPAGTPDRALITVLADSAILGADWRKRAVKRAERL
ncbi:MOSC domain-containing protein [Porphyrobacter algicida]|uniref:MOSC domain-containing protein n=1 Tax=Qipengyuania algicida TaxID=1836209 RepID=A0A845AFQ1_9SPHN|nr:MOSC domain-containing protein [Qipengyuania algicida]MXP27376.1 MOSC domain-containing protein [Qipengyuania algicida]